MSSSPFSKFSRQSPLGIVINYGVLLYKLVKSFWVFIPIFFSDSIENKGFYILNISGVLIVLLLLVAIVQFLFFKFKIEGDQFILNKGLIFKNKTAIPIERIQSVNFKQNILHQLVGVTQVEIQTAGAKEVEVSIKAVTKAVAKALKSELQKTTLVKKSENEGVENPVFQSEKRRVVYALSFLDLLKVSFSENHLRSFFWILAITFSFGYQLADIVEDWNFADEMIQYVVLNKEEIVSSLLGLSVLLVVGVVISVVVSFLRVVLRHFDQKVRYQDEGIEVSEGLLTKREDVLKIKKIQTIIQVTNPIKRAMGIETVKINQAGSAKMKQKKLVELVGVKAQFALELMELFYKTEGADVKERFNPAPYFMYRMFVRTFLFLIVVNVLFFFNSSTLLEFFLINVLLIPSSLYLVYLKKNKTYFEFKGEKLVVGDGKITTITTGLEYYKTQNIKLVQSIIQKRRGVATIKIQTASGVVVLPCLFQSDALKIQEKILTNVENSTRDWI